ncbi:MAG: thioredoxin-dependent thiol peroxidase [Treponema sp.]|nr:thioredoxin-dependent thiol peroxidase [Treponema sp.]
MLKEGSVAPNFALPDKDGNIVKLEDFKGQKVVLYFYPKDNTPGCTKQANAFRNNFEEYKRNNIVVIGVSKDSEKSHQNFSTKYDLPFILLSDTELTAIKAYDVWQEKSLYGKKYMGIVRSTYIIDEHGTIIKVFEKAKPDTNASDVLQFLGDLRL